MEWMERMDELCMDGCMHARTHARTHACIYGFSFVISLLLNVFFFFHSLFSFLSWRAGARTAVNGVYLFYLGWVIGGGGGAKKRKGLLLQRWKVFEGR
ncbi:hypothetical protein BDY21DRAFT_339536 [Lineolata rhizophorae]|uniref:Uncharacterized protein n=1 Tax=Lineolata rhizophorae TaxID=578093 RepID=A0A6A6P4U4_9PEZI|nr:hypothetical protein BDY21DRAFT_339536 [Lineolata rhizophorae]